MAGGYDPLNPPKRAGFYNRIMAAAQSVALGGNGSVVAMPLVTDWGPTGVTRITNQREFEKLFGTTSDDAHFTVVGALTGTGDVGDGASAVLVQRIDPNTANVGAVAAAYATRTFNNTTPTTPGAALTVRAKYKGTHGNDVTVTFRDHPSDASLDQLLVYVRGTLTETYDYAQTDLASLAAKANAASAYVFLTVNIDGVTIAPVTSQGLTTTAGANGTAVAADYSQALSALEAQAFSVIVMPGMTDATILASLRQWVATVNSSSRRLIGVTGGAAGETFSVGQARSALSNTNENIASLIYNVFKDPNGVTRSTAQMAGHVAGMIAAAGAKRSITFSRLPKGFDLTTAPTNDEIVAAINGGSIVFSKDASGIRVEKGVTTFTSTTDVNKPLAVFSSIQQVRTIHMIENDLTETTEAEWIGKVQNTANTRDAYLGMLLAYFLRLEADNIVKPGSKVRLDASQNNTGDTLYPIYSITMARAIERVLAIGEVA